MRPVIAGMWKQRETWDGTYSFADLIDAHEMLDVQEENTRRIHEAISRQRG